MAPGGNSIRTQLELNLIHTDSSELCSALRVEDKTYFTEVRGTQRENFSKILETSFNFYFLRLFQSFLKANLCKLIQVDLFGVLAESLGC